MVHVSYRLSIDHGAAAKVGGDAAYRDVVDVTRRVLNQATIDTPVDTGRLRAGNQSHVTRTGARAVGEVFNNTSYAAAVHDGARAHTVRPKPQTITIVPRKGKLLRFEVDGRVVYARKVVTQKPLAFKVGGRWVYAMSARIPARKARPWLLDAMKKVAIPRGYTIDRT